MVELKVGRVDPDFDLPEEVSTLRFGLVTFPEDFLVAEENSALEEEVVGVIDCV